jgi:elongation factor Ts
MSKADLGLIQKLREISGLGMLDCKKALEEAGNDLDKAIELLRKKGAAVAAKRADKGTSEGIIHAYIHPGSQIGVLIEINCETDFVAKLDEIKTFANDVCLQIAALKPQFLSPEEVDPSFLAKEREILAAQLKDSGKPANMLDKIVEGRVSKLYSEICLLNQPFLKNDKLTVEEAAKELIGKTGENIKIKRFARFEIGA